MARIDDLIGEIPDKGLRTRLQREVADLKKEKKFGLVFEQHLPELVPMYGSPIRRGARVAERSKDFSRTYLVKGTRNGIPATERDVETLFGKAKGILTEDVAMAFWRNRHDEQEPLRAKVETFEIAQDAVAWRDIEQAAGAMLHTYFQQSRTSIISLAGERRAKYEEIVATARRAESFIFDLPASIAVDVPSDAKIVESHIYVDEEKKFRVSLNTWEEAVVREETARSDFVCWLRNFHRKPWSLAYVYEIAGEERPGFPDFVSVRKQGATFVADILEPHQGDDSLVKAKGLAKYAERHGVHVGRVEMIRKDGALLKRVNLSDPIQRSKVNSCQRPDELDHLFDIA